MSMYENGLISSPGTKSNEDFVYYEELKMPVYSSNLFKWI